MSSDIKPRKIVVLATGEQIKGYVHPTRISIVKMLAMKKRTISNVAKELGVHPANITHHFKLLEKTGLIRIVERKDIGKNIEKYYRAVAYSFVVAPDQTTKPNKAVLELSVLKNNLSVAMRTIQKKDNRDIIALLKVIRLRPEDRKQFFKKLHSLINDLSKYDSKEGILYTINVSSYPNDTDYASKEKVVID